MLTHCPVTKRLEHPVDMLREFSGRIAVFDHAAHYALLLREKGSIGAEIPADIARALQVLATDFRTMHEAVDEWFEKHGSRGAE